MEHLSHLGSVFFPLGSAYNTQTCGLIHNLYVIFSSEAKHLRYSWHPYMTSYYAQLSS